MKSASPPRPPSSRRAVRLSSCTTESSDGAEATLYDVPVSNNGARVRLLLYWKGIEAKVKIENPAAIGGLKSEQYLSLNPQGKMPLLVVETRAEGEDARLAIPESEVIVQYLLDKYRDTGPSLIPESLEQRAYANLAVRVHDQYVVPIQGCMYRGPMPVPKRAEDLKQIAKQMEIIEGILRDAASSRSKSDDAGADGPFIAGRDPCYADAALFPTYVFVERILPKYFGWDADVFGEAPRTKTWFNALARDAGGSRILHEIRNGLDDWDVAKRWETTGVLDAVRDETLKWKYP